MDFFSACILNPLLTYAIISGLIASLIGGAVGAFVVSQRITYISNSISHSILGGIGLFLWLERAHGWSAISPIMGAMISGICAAIFIYVAKKRFRDREDSLISALWTFGMSAGIIFISKTPGYSVELTNFLIGNILWVTKTDLLLLSALAIFALLFIYFYFQQLKLIAFDQQEARLQGVPIERISLFLLIIIAITVVTLMQVVGVVLVSSMLTIPQMIAGLFVQRLSSIIFLSCCISSFLTTAGLILSFYVDWPSGATISILSISLYVVAHMGIRLQSRIENG
ncbi:MAG: metal ABC transporter permease [Chlamydia sp.]